jgi:hypothetical protein
MMHQSHHHHAPQGALLTLIHPRAQTRALLTLLALSLTLGGILVTQAGMPLWGATLLGLGLLGYPAVQKWRDDLQRWGVPLTVLSVLVALQGFHTIEHVAQWIEFHVLHWQPKESGGLISPLNAEIVHFVWNWAIVCTVAYLFRRGLRNPWGYLLLAWSLAHSLEHLYLFIQYLQYVGLLWQTGRSLSFAQGLPGILGSHGWLDTRGGDFAATAFVCRLVPLPFLTATRLDVHFWWNIGEVALLLPYAHGAMRRHLHGRGSVPPVASAAAAA